MQEQQEVQEQPVEYFTDKMHREIFPFPETAFSSRALKNNTSHFVSPARIMIPKSPGVRTQIRRNN